LISSLQLDPQLQNRELIMFMILNLRIYRLAPLLFLGLAFYRLELVRSSNESPAAALGDQHPQRDCV
jgi:hypothetical protein